MSKRSPGGSSVSLSKQPSLEEKDLCPGSAQQATADEKRRRSNGQKVGAKPPQNGVVGREILTNAEEDWVEAQSKRLGKANKVQRVRLPFQREKTAGQRRAGVRVPICTAGRFLCLFFYGSLEGFISSRSFP